MRVDFARLEDMYLFPYVTDKLSNEMVNTSLALSGGFIDVRECEEALRI